MRNETDRHYRKVESAPNFTAALLSRSPELEPILRFLFSGSNAFRRFRDLRVPPAITSHCNVVRADDFMIPGARFGNDRDVPMMPLVCRVVVETVESVAGYYPQVRDYLPDIPVAAYGSMGLSVRRTGAIDWDYIRDLDFRIFLPPQIGHTSGFKGALERRLDLALRHEGLKPVFRGLNEESQPQVQLKETESGAIHGFHFYLLSMKPGFIRANIHEGGGYSMYHAYFPNGVMDRYLAQGLLWQELLEREVETYASMFNRVGYFLFSDDRDKRNVMRKRGWYPHKAFKWYATLARMRGDFGLERELLAQYDRFKDSRADPQYLVRDSYYSRLNPERAESVLLERDIAQAFSREYSLGRTPDGDALLGERTGSDPDSPLLLEPVGQEWLTAALALLAANRDLLSSEFNGAKPTGSGSVETNGIDELNALAGARHIRFADDLQEPGWLVFPNGQGGIALPSGWALLFTDGYARLAANMAQESGHPFAYEEVRQALLLLLASQIGAAHGKAASDR